MILQLKDVKVFFTQHLLFLAMSLIHRYLLSYSCILNLLKPELNSVACVQRPVNASMSANYVLDFEHCFFSFPFDKMILQEELINPAVKGTLNVLRSCAKVPSIKRVIVTSSMAAVAFNGKPLAPDVIVDETWFSGPSFCEKSKVL